MGPLDPVPSCRLGIPFVFRCVLRGSTSQARTRLRDDPVTVRSFPEGEKVFRYVPAGCGVGPEEFCEYSPKSLQMMYLP